MTYTFKINKIISKKDPGSDCEIVERIYYSIVGTNDESPAETASYDWSVTCPADELMCNCDLTEEQVIAIARRKFDNDAMWREEIQNAISSSIIKRRTTKKSYTSDSFPWNNNSPE